MRVVHILKITGIAGAENHLLILLSGLRAQGVDARFLLLVEPHNPVEAFAAACDARKIPYERLVIYHHADVTVLFRLWRSLRRLKPDLVHTHMLHGDLYGIPSSKLVGIPVLTSRHGDDDFRRHKIVTLLNRVLWRLCDGGIAISEALRDFSIQVEGASAKHLWTIHYGIDAASSLERSIIRQQMQISDEHLILGVVCRLIPLKGVIYAVQAFVQIVSSYPQAQLLIIGDGPVRENLEKEVAEYQVDDRVFFLGWQPNAGELISAMDVLLVPSTREGLGLVILEAMAQRVPVIGSRVSAIPEVIVDGETGFLVPPRNATALATAIHQLLGDPVLRERMGAAGRSRLEKHFSTARMVELTLQVYEKVTGRQIARTKSVLLRLES